MNIKVELLAKALCKIRPEASFAIEDGVLKWLSADVEKPSEEEIIEVASEIETTERVEEIKAQRLNAYRNEADPLFFKAMRNEDGITLEDWKAKVEEIRRRYPLEGGRN